MTESSLDRLLELQSLATNTEGLPYDSTDDEERKSLKQQIEKALESQNLLDSGEFILVYTEAYKKLLEKSCNSCNKNLGIPNIIYVCWKCKKEICNDCYLKAESNGCLICQNKRTEADKKNEQIVQRLRDRIQTLRTQYPTDDEFDEEMSFPNPIAHNDIVSKFHKKTMIVEELQQILGEDG